MDFIIAHAPLYGGLGIAVYAVISACTTFVVHAWPLMSDKACKRAVRIIKAKKQS